MLFEKYKNCKVFSDKLCDDITQDVMDIDGHWYTYGTICDKYIFLAFSAFLGTDFHFIRSGVESSKGVIMKILPIHHFVLSIVKV